MTEEKIQSIEIAIAHHDSQLHDLSEMISKQWKEIERLKFQLDKANAKIIEMELSGDGAKTGSNSSLAASEKPPHY